MVCAVAAGADAAFAGAPLACARAPVANRQPAAPTINALTQRRAKRRFIQLSPCGLYLESSLVRPLRAAVKPGRILQPSGPDKAARAGTNPSAEAPRGAP